MSLPGRYDLTGDDPTTGKGLYRGDTRDWSVALFQDDGVTPITDDLSSGHTFRAQVRATADDTTVMAAITVTATDAHTLAMHLPASEAINLTGGSAVWDLEVTRTSDGNVHTYLAGDVDILHDASRA